MHSLLRRQLRRYPPEENLEAFLASISEAYEASDEDRLLMERSMDLASQELLERNEHLARQMEETKRTMEELVESEAALKQAMEQMKQMDAARAAFINAAAHELGTPLTPLKLQVHVVKNSVNKEQVPGIELLERNVDRLTLLVRDLLDSSKIQAGKLHLETELIDISTLVAASCDSFAALAQNVEVALSYHGSEQLEVVCDQARMAQVMDNLLSNAFKNTAAGGEVNVTVTKKSGSALISVKDTGIGIQREDFDKLFQPFSQLGDGAHTSKTGTGLGLHISRGLVERSGGEIWVESEGLGKGAAFFVKLPIAQ